MPVDFRNQRDRKRVIERGGESKRERERTTGEMRGVVNGEGTWERVGGDKHVRGQHTCVVGVLSQGQRAQGRRGSDLEYMQASRSSRK